MALGWFARNQLNSRRAFRTGGAWFFSGAPARDLCVGCRLSLAIAVASETWRKGGGGGEAGRRVCWLAAAEDPCGDPCNHRGGMGDRSA